jgi:hypothetical protein
VRLDVAGDGRSQQAALGAGTQHNYFGGMPSDAETLVSIAPPAGQRDARFPLRGRDELLGELLADGGADKGSHVYQYGILPVAGWR